MLYDLTIPQFIKVLHNLSRLLDKASQFSESKKIENDVLPQMRLAPDQFNLTRQVQIACDTAKLGVARLSGKEAPAHEDSEKTLPERSLRPFRLTKCYDFSRGLNRPQWPDQRLRRPDQSMAKLVRRPCEKKAITNNQSGVRKKR